MTAQRYLLDTNVLSESRLVKANPGVRRFFSTIEPTRTHLSVLTLGELRNGLARKRKRNPEDTANLASWLAQVEDAFAERILPVDQRTAALWGELSADRSRPVVDTLLAATALVHDLTLVTRNVKDFSGLGVKLLNPWS